VGPDIQPFAGMEINLAAFFLSAVVWK